jgi:hypothetical protein
VGHQPDGVELSNVQLYIAAGASLVLALFSDVAEHPGSEDKTSQTLAASWA